MRWFLTSECPELEREIAESGGSVVNSKGEHFYDFVNKDDPELNEYPLNRFLPKYSPLDVCVLIDPFSPPGIKKSHAVKWSYPTKRILIGWSSNDPENAEKRMGHGLSRCRCRFANMGIYVTNDEETARKASRSTRAVLFTNNFTDILGLIEIFKEDSNSFLVAQRLNGLV